jgi:phosphoserine phosphatase RsbU/P
VYASGGHPPALLVEPSAEVKAAPAQLSTGGRVIGCDPDAEFRSETRELRRGSRLYVFSDGAYELSRPDGKTMQLPDLMEELGRSSAPGVSKLDELLAWAKVSRGDSPLEDDLSLLELEL